MKGQGTHQGKTHGKQQGPKAPKTPPTLTPRVKAGKPTPLVTAPPADQAPIALPTETVHQFVVAWCAHWREMCKLCCEIFRTLQYVTSRS